MNRNRCQTNVHGRRDDHSPRQVQCARHSPVERIHDQTCGAIERKAAPVDGLAASFAKL